MDTKFYPSQHKNFTNEQIAVLLNQGAIIKPAEITEGHRIVAMAFAYPLTYTPMSGPVAGEKQTKWVEPDPEKMDWDKAKWDAVIYINSLISKLKAKE